MERIAAPKITLSPSQRKAADGIIRALERNEYALLMDEGHDGKTTVLGHIQAELGGARVGAREFLKKLATAEPLAVEEAFVALIEAELDQHDLVLVDDFHLVLDVSDGGSYPRTNLIDIALKALLAHVAASGKRIVFASDQHRAALSQRAHSYFIQNFKPEDFEVICSAYLDPAVSRRLDFVEIHRFAPNLSAHHLRKASMWLAHEPGLDTKRFCGYLGEHNLQSNVEVEEVEAVTWDDLKGVAGLIQELEAKIALPFENRELAIELDLKPKRGVLLAGPPGTGKTTIGRALAHRLRGKFFLVDGTMIAGSGDFYCEIDRVFREAEQNAPSVVFIDDADVIFGGEKEQGLYRYLLTKLDGLESRAAGRICVMMTAMEPADLPAAILRSGRVELWLETRLPDTAAREEILRERLSPLPPPLSCANIATLAEASRGCTGADLKAIIDDAKLHFAYDKVKGREPRPVEDYFHEAIAAVRSNRLKYRKRKPVHLMEHPAYGFQTEVAKS